MTEPAGEDAAERLAELLVEGFDESYRRFREISAGAKERFEHADWTEVQRAVRERIRLEDEQVDRTVAQVRGEIAAPALDEAVWRRGKLHYIVLLVDHQQPELAETFFNSVSTRVLGRSYVRNDFMFVRATTSTEYIPSDPPSYRSYNPRGALGETFVSILRGFGWRRPFADLDRDVDYLVRALEGRLAPPEPNFQVSALGSAFYRNKAAYVVGKIVNGDDTLPFAVAVVHDAESRLAIDTMLLDSASIDILFSLSRAYFMVDIEVPSGFVEFLQTIMPTKPRSEIYSSLGFQKQSKTIFFRDLLHHLDHSEDLFVEAPGTRGQVMHVFTLPSYPYVFKVIRDRFGPTKNTTHEAVRQKFQLVKEVDRVGRMVDALEFADLALPRARFAPELFAQLKKLAPSAIERDGEHLIVKHCYVERRMTPLDLYLKTASAREIDRVVCEYGNALRELAIADIFPGDLLWRNFGLTRHGRVVCYDYDELGHLTDCVFRSFPPAPNPEAELAEEVWYAVGSHDVFPEEFATFLLGRPGIRKAFLRHHSELLRAEFWQECQSRVAAGEIVDFFPYPDGSRFVNRFRARGRPAAAVAPAR
ncbi:MAG TPA: bifunctional isocitrate dehydrogenase kinase/phosphatase [Gaiellaceae bacterium]|nr:bifunctional isocitrate dehydrogenase kinase/phosphatase [Gaiellaceae bacterium]